MFRARLDHFLLISQPIFFFFNGHWPGLTNPRDISDSFNGTPLNLLSILPPRQNNPVAAVHHLTINNSTNIPTIQLEPNTTTYTNPRQSISRYDIFIALRIGRMIYNGHNSGEIPLTSNQSTCSTTIKRMAAVAVSHEARLVSVN